MSRMAWHAALVGCALVAGAAAAVDEGSGDALASDGSGEWTGVTTATSTNEPYEPGKPIIDDYTGHELCFVQSLECPVHECPGVPHDCVLVPPESGLAPLQIDFDGLCCPSACFAVHIETGEPCLATGKVPAGEEGEEGNGAGGDPYEWFPPELDAVTGRELCYEAEPNCPAEPTCPSPPDGCAPLAASGKTLLEIDPATGLCCALPCATVKEANGDLCSWVDSEGHEEQGEGTYDIVDEHSGGKLCFNESTPPGGCPEPPTCATPPTGCILLSSSLAPLEVTPGSDKCCRRSCVFVDRTGKECRVDGPHPDAQGDELPPTHEAGSTEEVKLCYDESTGCPAHECGSAARRRRRGELGFGCFFLDAPGESPLALTTDGKCCPLPCLTVDAEGKPCADNRESADDVVNATQLDVCFEQSGTCPPAPECDPAPQGCHLLAAEHAPLVRVLDGQCCPEACVTVNSTTGKKCVDKLSLPWVEEGSGADAADANVTTVIVVDTQEVHVCVEPDHDCAGEAPVSCPEAPAGCHYLNASTFVKRNGKCCPLGCVAVSTEHPEKQCEAHEMSDTAPTGAPGEPCEVPSGMCPVARCQHYDGCKLHPHPAHVFDEEGHCCPAKLCPYIQDLASRDVCEHDAAAREAARAGNGANSSTVITTATSSTTSTPEGTTSADRVNETNARDHNAHGSKDETRENKTATTAVVVTFVILLTVAVVLAVMWVLMGRGGGGGAYRSAKLNGANVVLVEGGEGAAAEAGGAGAVQMNPVWSDGQPMSLVPRAIASPYEEEEEAVVVGGAGYSVA